MEPSLKHDQLLSVKRLLGVLLGHPLIFIASLMVSLAIGWLANRYLEPIYTVEGTLLIDKTGRPSVNKLLYGQDALSGGMAQAYYGLPMPLSNEMAFLQSSSFLRRVITNLDFDVSYRHQGKIRTSEVYPEKPFKLVKIAPSDSTWCDLGTLKVIILNESEFDLALIDGKTSEVSLGKYQFGDSVYHSRYVFRLDRLRASHLQPPTYFVNFNSNEKLISYYKKILKMSQRNRDAGVLDFTIESPAPAKDARFLDAFMRTYVQYRLESRTAEAGQIITFINAQLAQVADSLTSVENRLERFKSGKMLVESANAQEQIVSKRLLLEASKNQVLLSGQYLRYLEDYLAQNTDYEKISSPLAYGVEGMDVLNNLTAKLVEIQIELNSLVQKGKIKNPAVAELKLKIDNLKANIAENLRQIKGNLQITLGNVNQQISQVEREIRSVPTNERQMTGIKRRFALNENLYLLLLEKELEAEISQAAATSDIQILEKAMVNELPVRPKKFNNYFIALFFGLSLPMIGLLVYDQVRNTVKTVADLEQLADLPIYGSIAHQNHKKGEGVWGIVDRPKSQLAESFRSIRANLAFVADQTAANTTVLVTSNISGEGKSFCSAGLAIVLAATHQKTLLIMTDLRKPKLYLSPQGVDLGNLGLSNYLSSQVSSGEIIQESSIPYLSFISCGPIPPNPTELLMRPRMLELLASLKQSYRYIVIDTAPIGLVSDALALMQYVDASVLVTRQNHTTRPQVEFVNRLYAQGKIKNAGFVLNDVARVNRYGYGGYGYYYGYGNYGSNDKGYYEEGNKG
ncbi:MAG: polysaccharide biosynthesis tyrosine autokinase [Bernardetiaceae bacterium]|jgi:capsular exopolysaccharide synthesis family protein|nr:polysaccharide biosynthesis tyrosine autokinase [Bernardetiaceae bacterium]